MSQTEKLKSDFLSCAGEFPFRDFVRLLAALGYQPVKKGKTSGSRRKFYHPDDKHILMLHEPHSGRLGPGTIAVLREELRLKGKL